MKAVAFKVSYNDGGAGAGLVGYRGVCTPENAFGNVRIRKMTNCSDPDNPCRKYVDNECKGRAPVISSSGTPWCYEARLLQQKPFRFGAGYYHNGKKAGDPIPMVGVEVGDIALLTTLLPGGTQKDRIIFGCFQVGSIEFVDGWGYMAKSNGKMDLQLPDDIARHMNFWRYFQNSDKSQVWKTGLFRYLTEQNTEKMLTELIVQLGDDASRDVILTALPKYRTKPTSQPPSFQGSGFGGGESDAHLKLKEYVAKHPEKIGLPKTSKATIEFPYLSGDRVDIKFDIPGKDESAVVEIETIDPLPGAHQCIKYRALLEASLGLEINSKKVRAILVAHHFDSATKQFAKNYNITLFELKL